jgi:hypothetical protein
MVILIKGMKIYSCRLILIAVQFESLPGFCPIRPWSYKKKVSTIDKKNLVLYLRGVLYSSKYGITSSYGRFRGITHL